MGNQCTSGNNDPYGGQGFIMTEQFEIGQRPIIIQEHGRFNDDDPIDVVVFGGGSSTYGRKSLTANYMKQARYILQDNVTFQATYCTVPTYNIQALLISLRTKDQGTQFQREGIDLVCLIDHSGSMAGEKMKLVKKSLRHLLTLLQINDRLCLIEFDDQNYRLTRLMRVTQENINKFRIAIDTIEANGGTDIGLGMKMALSVLKHRKYKNPVASIFLLSDGEDEGAAGRVWKDIQQKDIREPYTIFTFGFGCDCCPRIMSEIAHFKEGQFYYISEISRIDECFVEALGGQVSVVAYNTKITVKQETMRTNIIRKAYGDKWVFDQYQNVYTIYQPQLQCGSRKDFIIELAVPQGVSDEFIKIAVHTYSVETAEEFISEQRIQILPYFVPEQSITQEIMSHYYRVQAAELFKSSLTLAYNGQYQEAQQQLFQLQQQIYQANINDPQITVVYADLYQGQKYCDPNYFNQEGRHYLTQLYMVHMYQQTRGVDIVSQDQNVKLQCAYQNQLQQYYIQQIRDLKNNNPNYYID